ncbi:MAG: LysM peptidoglycan-binding domain-containing protein [Bacteroidetes bacterium]|nr:LysM peptidoglycan-binding domain-containing protein [Bacteroidota bacterium]
MKKVLLFASLLVTVGIFAAKDGGIVSHKIQQHETLFRISLMYNSTVNDIEKANPGVDAKHIHEGAVIKVPKNTKMRDPEFVASFLNENHYNETQIEHVAAKITTARSAPADRPHQISMPAQQQAPKHDIREEKPVKDAKAEPVRPAYEPGTASKKVAAEPLSTSNFASDENPFITPSDPKPSAAAGEQHARVSDLKNKESELEDENPFVTPKEKAEDKDDGKISSND